jgi:hypothetical protein
MFIVNRYRIRERECLLRRCGVASPSRSACSTSPAPVSRSRPVKAGTPAFAAQRLQQKTVAAETDEQATRIDELQEAVARQAAQLTELQERMDFAERMLTQVRDRQKLGGS